MNKAKTNPIACLLFMACIAACFPFLLVRNALDHGLRKLLRMQPPKNSGDWLGRNC
jgi:hypothetical protein